MRRSGLGVLVGLVLALSAGGGVAVASPPATPQITAVTATWGMYEWDDGSTRCTLIAEASLDPAFKGQPVFAHAYVHFKWTGPGGEWQELNFWNLRLSHGATKVHVYTSFGPDGYDYLADWVRFDLTTLKGDLASSMEISTTNTCPSA